MALEFFKRLIRGSPQRVDAEKITQDEFFNLSNEYHVRELAFYQCVNLIASAVSKCEFKTFHDSKEIKNDEYFRWNYSPNKNQSSSVFLHKLIAKLFTENEALVVETADHQLLIADSYSRKEYALYDDIFTQVTVGDFQFQKSFAQSEVLFFKLNEKAVRPLVNGMYDTYRKLIDCAMKGYCKSRGTKGTLSADAMISPQTQEAFTELKNVNFRKFAEAENAVLPLPRGVTYTDLGSKTYTNEATRDIRALIDDIVIFTARAFGIPPALLSGEVQGMADALEQFLTFCIDPLADLLSEEINRKLYGKGILTGDYIQIDTKCIKHVDLLSVSTAIDKLIASGAYCINDIRKVTGEPIIDEPWANQHFMTKNYATVQDLLESLQNEVNK